MDNQEIIQHIFEWESTIKHCGSSIPWTIWCDKKSDVMNQIGVSHLDHIMDHSSLELLHDFIQQLASVHNIVKATKQQATEVHDG